jgi:hypothetical protein
MDEKACNTPAESLQSSLFMAGIALLLGHQIQIYGLNVGYERIDTNRFLAFVEALTVALAFRADICLVGGEAFHGQERDAVRVTVSAMNATEVARLPFRETMIAKHKTPAVRCPHPAEIGFGGTKRANSGKVPRVESCFGKSGAIGSRPQP